VAPSSASDVPEVRLVQMVPTGEDWIVPLSPTATSWLLPAAIPFKLFKVAEFLGVQESPSLET
jgi:hypothetical protein